MKALYLFVCTLFVLAALLAQRVAPFTADAYLVAPASYLDKEVTLAVAYVMPQEKERADGLQGMMANTYNLNQFDGHILVVAPPEIAQRVAQQCGTMHVWNHSHITFIHGIFKKDEEKGDHYYILVPK